MTTAATRHISAATRISALIGRTGVAIAALAVCGLGSFAVAGASSSKVIDGAYSGEVGAGYPMSFTVGSSGTTVLDLTVSFDETCNGSPPATPPKFHYPTLTITDGTFSSTTKDRFGKTFTDNLQITGTFTGDQVKGSVTSKAWIKSLGSCSENERFTASLKK